MFRDKCPETGLTICAFLSKKHCEGITVRETQTQTRIQTQKPEQPEQPEQHIHQSEPLPDPVTLGEKPPSFSEPDPQPDPQPVSKKRTLKKERRERVTKRAKKIAEEEA